MSASENARDYAASYLPIDCPVCGRRRLLGAVRVDGGDAFVPAESVECEKCGWNPEIDTEPYVKLRGGPCAGLFYRRPLGALEHVRRFNDVDHVYDAFSGEYRGTR